jgi:hypothetical protein
VVVDVMSGCGHAYVERASTVSGKRWVMLHGSDER